MKNWNWKPYAVIGIVFLLLAIGLSVTGCSDTSIHDVYIVPTPADEAPPLDECNSDFICKTAGVLANERVIDLPLDQAKWYISVVGIEGSEHYKRLLAWFDGDEKLAKLKSQVHFRPIKTDTVIFNERYELNIAGLPTIRMQEADGTVVYEAAGKYLPLTPGGLYGAMVNSTFVSRGVRPILPWRRDMENRPCPGPGPDPIPDPDPAPQPLDDTGPPEVVDSGPSIILLVLVGILSFVVGVAVGVAVEWKREYRQE